MGLNNPDFQGTLEGAAQQAPPASAYDNSTASSAAVSPTAAPAGAPTAATTAPAQRASIAKLNQDLAESSWRLTREKADFQVANLGMMTNARNLVMGDPSNGNEDFGTYPSFKDFLDKHHQNGAAIGRMNAT